MYFHENKDLFAETIEAAQEVTGIEKSIIEKDYYVTLILNELHKRRSDCVFKGGTSLSKCFKAEIVEEYNLKPFDMQVQSLNRTFIDKIFALCDYYMLGKSQRLSRHLYDLYKLRNFVPLDENLVKLKNEVRLHRKKIKVCPSSSDEIDIKSLSEEFCKKDFYRDDYEKVTSHFIYDSVSYDDAIKNYLGAVEFLFGSD